MKKIAVGALLLLLAALAGCAAAPGARELDYGADSEVLRFTLIAPPLENRFWDDLESGMRSAALEAGNVDVLVTRAQGRGQEDYDRCFDSAILARADGVITICVDEALMQEDFRKVRQAGIPLVLIGNDVGDTTLRDGYCGIDNLRAGRKLGAYALEACGGEAKIAIISSSLNTLVVRRRIQGFGEAIANSPGMQVVARIQTDSDELRANLRTSEALRERPDISMLICLDGKSVVGAAKAVEELGCDVHILTFDDDFPIPDLLEAGVIDVTLVQDSYEMGRNAVKMLLELHRSGTGGTLYSGVAVSLGGGEQP